MKPKKNIEEQLHQTQPLKYFEDPKTYRKVLFNKNQFSLSPGNYK